jgi:GNAT superfamily N-acetyltransferase
MIRVASTQDAVGIAALVNAAFQVEAFFKIGDRTSPAEILEMMQVGEFLLVDPNENDGADQMLGCVYLRIHPRERRAYFGMLSIDPARQRRGFGRALIAAVENRARDLGCNTMDIHIVNLREELPAFYQKFGYVENGTLPFPSMERTSKPCHFVVMSKALAP